MSLTGNLEDLPLLDIIQIVSFSKKTGYLSISMEGGAGGIVFRKGLVVSAFTALSPPVEPRFVSLPADKREQAVRSRIGFALEQLARLREGAFAFELTEQVPRTLGSRDIADETMARGIDPQDLLLDLAAGMDEGQAESAAAVEASFAAPEEAFVDSAASEPIVPSVSLDSELEALAGESSEAGPASAVPPVIDEDAGPLDGLAPEVSAATPQADLPTAARPLPAVTPGTSGAGAHSVETVVSADADGDGPARMLLLVDDEPDVREILAGHFVSAGYQIEEAGDPETAARLAGRLRSERTPFVLVTDLGMPASGGASFHGGFEVVKRLWKMNLRPPVLMMTESLNQSLRLRARQMGIQAFVFKPTLSKLNRRQFEADLSAFAAKLAEDVLPRLAEVASLRVVPRPRKGSVARSLESPAGGALAADAARPFAFLRRRLRDLRKPGDSNEIAALVMKVAREFFERSVLFVVKNDQARGLGGFGLAPREETLNLLARQIAIPLSEPSLFRDAVHSGRAFAGPLPEDRWAGHLMGRIGRFQSSNVALLPLLAHHETIALLFGDNPETGRPIAGLDALEVFVHQAGIALENIFLQRKLQSLQDGEEAGLR